MKRVNSASTLYPNSGTGAVVRGHRRSMTVPLYQPSEGTGPGEVYQIAGDVYHLPQKILDLNLSCIMENSQSEDARTLSVLGVETLNRTMTDVTDLPTTMDESEDQFKELPPLQDSPLDFMDEKTHDIYALGLVSDAPTTPEVNGNVLNFADVEKAIERENH